MATEHLRFIVVLEVECAKSEVRPLVKSWLSNALQTCDSEGNSFSWRAGEPQEVSMREVLRSRGPARFARPQQDDHMLAQIRAVTATVEMSLGIQHTSTPIQCPLVRVQLGGPRSSPLRLCTFSYEDESEEDAAECVLSNGAVASRQIMLPAPELSNCFDAVVLDPQIKVRLQRYADTAMFFADKKVKPQIVACNRFILLHGPPGTGKTTLLKGLANKLAIRLSERFSVGILVEVNAHSLFSKYFSESGKLVQELFTGIKDLAQEQDAFVCVLIDEVESISRARESASGSDPSDAIRVVNALLTQIDALQAFPNVLLVATSNLSDTIDPAFLDRADIRLFIDLPGLEARYNILKTCLQELVRVGVIQSTSSVWDFQYLHALGIDEEGIDQCDDQSETDRISRRLLLIARLSAGASGRAIRKLPLLAHAFHIQAHETTMEEFLEAMEVAAKSLSEQQDQ